MVAEDLDVTMDRETDLVLIRGDIDLPRGTYRFDRFPPYVQSLRITSGTIQFPGNPEFNPNLAITAEYRNRTAEGPIVIETQIGGTLQRTQLVLTSNPPMSESDKVCFLAIGAPCVAAADDQLGQRLLQEYALGTLTSGISSALVGSTGLSYFNLRSFGGTGPSGVQAQQGLFDQTQVEFGWYAGEEVFFSFSQPLGGGAPSATLEWRFTNNWTLEARATNRYDERLFGLVRGTNLSNDRTFGLFLFREWTF
jgi:autotransporter translocation and assembly factor TamB